MLKLMRCGTVLVASLLLWQTPVSAQNLNLVGGPSVGEIDVQNFDPSASPYDIFAVESSQTSADLQVSGGLILNFSKDPLVITSSLSDEEIVIVENQLAADLLFALGLFDVFELGVALPVYFVNTAAVNNVTIEGATIGDLKLRPKFTILSAEDNPVGLAFYTHLGFPTGDAESFTSSGTFFLRPGVIVDTQIDKLLLAFNLGASVQEEKAFGDLTIGSEMRFGIGGLYELMDNFLFAGAEIFGSTTFDDFFKEQDTPVEGLVGLKIRTETGLNFELGAGGGIVPGFGAPTFRFFTGVSYADFDNDWDDDGILNKIDACPRDPEDRDLFEDEDGCPDPDNDKDGICDPGLKASICTGSDSCPLNPEDRDAFEDEDGCPDVDNDKDGVLDAAELRDGKWINLDKKGDIDCRNEPEDRDGFEDEDGCVDRDNDGDGILDASEFKNGVWVNLDKNKDRDCRNEPETVNGLDDGDGCPDKVDPDPDKDRIPTVRDCCPNQAETYNGILDEDGCPDGDDLAKSVGGEIKIFQKVFFDLDRATIKDEQSERVLIAVANVLKSHHEIVLLEVQGHTDDQGNDDYNLTLSDKRSNTVRNFLIKAGVEPDRLKARGYGETNFLVPINVNGRPLRGAALKAARDKNRRVEFKILKKNNSLSAKIKERTLGSFKFPDDCPDDSPAKKN